MRTADPPIDLHSGDTPPPLAPQSPSAMPGAGDRVEGIRRVPAPILFVGLAALLVVASVVAAGVGAFTIAPGDVIGSVLHRLGLVATDPVDTMANSVLWEIRFPRIVLAAVVGASLGCAGAAMQGTFSNPLAEPGIVGVSSGAVLGAAAQIVLGITFLGAWSVTGSAFLAGLLTVLAVYAASRSNGRTEVVTLVLTGIAVNALAGALIGMLTFFSDDEELRSLTFWTLGSVAQATWAKVAVVLPIALVGIAASTLWARKLDLLALGERPARHLGVDVERVRLQVLVIVAMLTAAAVAVSGVILFVGLVIPHLVRMAAGPSHRVLLPASALAGAGILVIADTIARTAAAPAELPLGVLTALVGSPFFFWQLRRTRARQGGWA